MRNALLHTRGALTAWLFRDRHVLQGRQCVAVFLGFPPLGHTRGSTVNGLVFPPRGVAREKRAAGNKLKARYLRSLGERSRCARRLISRPTRHRFDFLPLGGHFCMYRRRVCVSAGDTTVSRKLFTAYLVGVCLGGRLQGYE